MKFISLSQVGYTRLKRIFLHITQKTNGFWYAEYSSKPTSSLRFGIWQYTKAGSVDGIEREVDIDLDLTDALVREDGGKPAS